MISAAFAHGGDVAAWWMALIAAGSYAAGVATWWLISRRAARSLADLWLEIEEGSGIRKVRVQALPALGDAIGLDAPNGVRFGVVEGIVCSDGIPDRLIVRLRSGEEEAVSLDAVRFSVPVTSPN